MQLNELIPSITLVLHQHVLMFVKLAIPRQKSGFSRNLSLGLYSLTQYGAMINDKLHMEE